MKYFKIYFFFIIALGLIISSCTDLQDDISQPAEVSVHSSQSLVKSSPDFHGKQLVNKKMDDCKRCHQSDFSGGITGVSCSSANCHPTISVHNENQFNPSSQQFHGKYFKAFNKTMNACSQCHGTTWAGSSISPSCSQCHSTITVHTSNIMNPSSSQFHGKYITGLNWNMAQCRTCHGSNYSGGFSSPTCNTCHNKPGGPESCNTCHGDFGNASRIAPPRALNNAILTSDPAVGAHSKHLFELTLSANTACNECHSVPTNITAAGHFDSTPKAEVKFGTLASGVGTASYNFTDNTCSNTYCHGSFEFNRSASQYPFAYVADKMTGNNYKPVWNKVDGSQGICGSCHGLPPAGHMTSTLSACATCHQGVINTAGKIIDKTKHINGKINVFGN